MDLTHHPDYNQSKNLKKSTQEKLISSLSYVLYICDDVIDKDTANKVHDFVSFAKSEYYSSGFLFYIIKKISKAIEKKSIEEINEHFKLIPKLNEISKGKVIIGRKENLPEGFFELYSRTKDDVYHFEHFNVGSENESCIKNSLNNAFTLIYETDPELHLEINEIVDEFFIFGAKEDHGNIPYSGSDFNKLGTVFINEETCKKDLYFLVDKIIHESAHQVLLSIMIFDEIVLNDDNERFPSPLRTGLRTMNGIYHAAFVLYRISFFFFKLVKETPDDTQATYYLNKNITQFKECYNVIIKHGQLTNTGRRLIQDCNHDIEAMLDGVY